MMASRHFAIAVLLAAAFLTGKVSYVGLAQDQAPTFRAGVQLIEVDVVVTDKDGNPVRDLTQDDFEIVENGRPQPIRTFTLIDLPLERAAEPGAASAPEPDVVGNSVPEGRTYVLVLDADSGNLRARHVAERWLNEVVQLNDRVAVVNARGTFSDAQPFTSSRRLILDAINRLIWGAGAGSDRLPPHVRQINALRAVKEIAERLAAIGGRRKAIVWICEDLSLHPQAGLKPGQLNNPFANAADLILDAWRDAARAAVNNNVTIHPVDPAGLTNDLGMGELVRQASMREVAEETGGRVLVNSNNFSDVFAAIVRDASTYYLLGYTPEPEQTDGQFHAIDVRIKRKGLTVRARRGYYAPDPKALPPKPLPVPPEGVSLAARDALRKPVATPGLGIDVTTTSFRGNGKDSSVVITAHVRGNTLEFEAGRRLAVSYQVFDLEGKVATGFYKVFGFSLGSETKSRATGTGLQFVERVSLKPGRYELRLVAEQPGGPIGSVVAPIEAGRFEDELELSGVALASRRAPEVLLVGDRPLKSALSVDPTALRSFRASDGVSAYAEVYTELDNNVSDAYLAAIRVATVGGAITTPEGVPLVRGQSQRVAAAPAGKMLREGFRTDFDLSRLTPGRYVVMIEGASGRDRKRTVTRQIPIDIVE